MGLNGHRLVMNRIDAGSCSAYMLIVLTIYKSRPGMHRLTLEEHKPSVVVVETCSPPETPHRQRPRL